MGQSQNYVTLSKMVLEFMWQILPLRSIEEVLFIIDLLSGLSTPPLRNIEEALTIIDLLSGFSTPEKIPLEQSIFSNLIGYKKALKTQERNILTYYKRQQLIFVNDWSETT